MAASRSRTPSSAIPATRSSRPATWLYSDGGRTPASAATRARVTASRPSRSAIAAARAITAARSRPRRGTSTRLGDRLVHPRARLLHDLAVAGGQARRVECAQRARRGELGRPVPGGERGEREARVRLRRGGDAAERRERVAAVQRAVARVEEGDVPGRVPRGGDDLERADALAGLEGARRLRARTRVAA